MLKLVPKIKSGRKPHLFRKVFFHAKMAVQPENAASGESEAVFSLL